MKALFIAFNQALYEEIAAILDKNGGRGFTFWDTVKGKGSRTGDPHFGSHAWPTLNSAIFSVVEESKVERILAALHELDMEAEAQGLRAFVMNVEGMI